MEVCGYCNGAGSIGGETCIICDGAKQTTCYSCYGEKDITCYICNGSGKVAAHTHNSSAYGSNATQHWTKCTADNDNNGTPVNHTWSNGQCSVCQYTCQHSGGTATCTTQATCSNCGASYGNLASHSYTTKASTQKASDATCTAAATYYVQCDNCTSVSTTATVSVGTANGHSYTTKVSTQKATDATCTEAATYYVQCDNCTSVSTTATVPVGAPTGHSFASTYSSDATGHWYAATCGHSSEKSGFATHRSSGPATEEAAEVCLDCGYEIAAKLPPKGKVNSVSLANAPKHSHYKCTDTIVPEIDVEGDVSYTVEFTTSNPDILKLDENGNICGARKWWHKTATVTCTVTDEYGNVVSDTCEIKCGFVWWQYPISIVYYIIDAITPLF